MRHWKRLFLFVLVVLFSDVTDFYAQDGGNGEGDPKSEQNPTGKAARRKAKREWKEKRKRDFDDAKAKKEYNKKYNSRKIRRRMKKNEKKAKRNNQHKREFFITRWIKRHRK